MLENKKKLFGHFFFVASQDLQLKALCRRIPEKGTRRVANRPGET